MPQSSAFETAELLLMSVKRMCRLADTELGKHGLSLSRSKILGILAETGPQQQSTLAATFGLAPRTITELVDTLVRDGHVERHTDPADRRARQVHLTVAGRKVHDQAITTRTHLLEQVFGVLSETQLRDLAAMLHQIDAAAAQATESLAARPTPEPILPQRGGDPELTTCN
jgi:DNA-binding MarR family transcriptional regulator